MTARQKIIPCLWFDDQAEPAVRQYAAIFPESRPGPVTRYSPAGAKAAGRPAGSVLTAETTVAGLDLVGLNGGPHVSFTPAISIFVTCTDAAETERVFRRLAEDGAPLMPLQSYPFSERYGWIVDRFGMSWQISTAPEPAPTAPCLMFVGDQCGRAEAAIRQYEGLFPGSATASVSRYTPDDPCDSAGLVKHAAFALAGQPFRAMDSGLDHAFTFSEAVSFQVLCESQAEIDHYWHGLGAGGEPSARRCGWLKDRFGVSWQIVPQSLPRMLRQGTADQVERVTEAVLRMAKLDMAALDRAFGGAA